MAGPEIVATWRDLELVGDEVWAIQLEDDSFRLVAYDLASLELRTLRPLPYSRYPHLAVAPDRSAVLCSRPNSSERDLILVDGFS